MNTRLLTIFYLMISTLCFSEPRKAITHSYGDRLGDKLVDYIHTKWVSYKWNLPLLYKPFGYSDQFVFHDVEEIWTHQKGLSFAHTAYVVSEAQLSEKVEVDTLYDLIHYPDSYDEFKFIGWGAGPYIAVDWNDQVFVNMIRSLIKPKNALQLIHPPQEIISVALHYRTGMGYDNKDVQKMLALRFPFQEYYFEQLRKLHELVSGSPLYVFIFTDHKNPLCVKEWFEKEFSSFNIVFECRASWKEVKANVVEDLFSMTQFDCLIRPCSHYSMTAAHLCDFKIEMYPKHGYFEQNKFIVDDVGIIQRANWDSNNCTWIFPQTD